MQCVNSRSLTTLATDPQGWQKRRPDLLEHGQNSAHLPLLVSEPTGIHGHPRGMRSAVCGLQHAACSLRGQRSSWGLLLFLLFLSPFPALPVTESWSLLMAPSNQTRRSIFFMLGLTSFKMKRNSTASSAMEAWPASSWGTNSSSEVESHREPHRIRPLKRRHGGLSLLFRM